MFGVLRSSDWGWIIPRPEGLSFFGISATLWFALLGLLITWLFLRWERRLVRLKREPLFRPQLLRNAQLAGGLVMFFFQYLLQAGIFFIVPLFLSVVLELSAMATGARLVPLSLALIISAAGIPKAWPTVSPRRVVRLGLLLLLGGIVILLAGIDLDANAAVVFVPMTLMGLGIGCLASQLGAVTVSAVPTEQGGEVGGLQNTAMNLGASIGTALAGSILILMLSLSLSQGIQQNPDVPEEVKSQAGTELSSGVEFVSDTALEEALAEAGVSDDIAEGVLEENRRARIDGLKAALAILAIIATMSLFFSDRIPTVQPGTESPEIEIEA